MTQLRFQLSRVRHCRNLGQGTQSYSNKHHSGQKGVSVVMTLEKTLVMTGKARKSQDIKDASQTEVAFAVFRSPEQFVRDAVAIGHPIQLQDGLPKPLEDAIKANVSTPTKELNEQRLRLLKEWTHRARSLAVEEAELKAKMPEHISHILAPKRVCPWKSLLLEYNYPDMGVVDELCSGTKLTGDIPLVPHFERSFKPALVTEEELREGAKPSRESTIRGARSSGDDFVDQEVYRKTLEERSAGWLRGPVDPQQLPHHAVVSKRFGLLQGSGPDGLLNSFDIPVFETLNHPPVCGVCVRRSHLVMSCVTIHLRKPLEYFWMLQDM